MAERLLILGGTAEAAELAGAASTRFGVAFDITTSLAGRTERPALWRVTSVLAVSAVQPVFTLT